MDILKEWCDKFNKALKPMTYKEEEESLAKQADKIETRAEHVEKVAAFNTRIANAKERIKKHKPTGLFSGSILNLSTGKVIIIIVIVVVIALLLSVC